MTFNSMVIFSLLGDYTIPLLGSENNTLVGLVKKVMKFTKPTKQQVML